MIDRIRRRLRKARRLAPGTRLAHLLEPVFNRAPTPFVFWNARRLGLPSRVISSHVSAARRAPFTRELIRRRVLVDASGHVGLVPGAFLYALVRALRPDTVVETGVASGMSSTFILQALSDNGRGRLVSIDLPFAEQDGEPAAVVPGTRIDRAQWSPLPAGREHGWLVPDELRARWDLRMGDARELLPAALAELGEIQIFLHDSLHTFEHMTFEFETAWPFIAAGGLLASDDVGQKGSDPLQQFAHSVGRQFVVQGGMGFIRKL